MLVLANFHDGKYALFLVFSCFASSETHVLVHHTGASYTV